MALQLGFCDLSLNQLVKDLEVGRSINFKLAFWLHRWLIVMECSDLSLELVVVLPQCLLLMDGILAIESRLLPIEIWLALLFIHQLFHIGEHLKVLSSCHWSGRILAVVSWGEEVLCSWWNAADRWLVEGPYPKRCWRPRLWTLRRWWLASWIHRLWGISSFEEGRGEILSVATELSIKTPVYGGDFSPQMIEWSIHTISERSFRM